MKPTDILNEIAKAEPQTEAEQFVCDWFKRMIAPEPQFIERSQPAEK